MAYIDDEESSRRSSAVKTEAAQLRALQLSAMSRVYEGADRILTGDPINVNVVSDGPAVTWSDGENIYINEKYIGDMSMEMLTKLSGLNYHELAHHFYTPREGTNLVKWVINNDYYTAFNILEDQRIESLLCARYPSVMPYLQTAALVWLQSTPDAAFTNYPLIAGRRHIDVGIREAFRDLFYKPELIPDIQRITNEYRCLAFPRDYKRAEKLIQEFHDLVISQLDIPPQCGLGGCDSRLPIKKGRPEPGKAQERDAKVANGMGKPESFYIPKEPAEQSQETPQTGGCMPTESSGEGDGEGPISITPGNTPGGMPQGSGETITQTADEAIQEREKNQQKNESLSKTWGNTHVKSEGGLPKDLNDKLNDDLQTIYNRKDVIKDIKRKQNIIVHGDENWDADAPLGKFESTRVPAAALMDYKKFANELRKLKDDSEPGWLRETPTGKLNVLRVMRGAEIDKAFDQWTEGDDSTDIEAVILIDRSSSMCSGRNDQKASIACWTIKRALESIDCPVTVYAFDDKNETAYRKTDKAERTNYRFIFGNGGTDPHDSLLLAERTFMMSQKANKMMFLITDGIFDSAKNNDIITRLGKRGVLTTLVLIMDEASYNDVSNTNSQFIAQHGKPRYDLQHGAEIFARINGGKDLLQLAKSVVVGAIKKRRISR
jgi:hypothetical protein